MVSRALSRWARSTASASARSEWGDPSIAARMSRNMQQPLHARRAANRCALTPMPWRGFEDALSGGLSPSGPQPPQHGRPGRPRTTLSRKLRPRVSVYGFGDRRIGCFTSFLGPVRRATLSPTGAFAVLTFPFEEKGLVSNGTHDSAHRHADEPWQGARVRALDGPRCVRVGDRHRPDLHGGD